jgi:hypothetical protein
MRTKSSRIEPTTAPRTDPAMTPAWWAWDDDWPRIGEGVDDDETEDKAEEGNREGGVETVEGGGVERVEDGDGDVVKGGAETEVGVAKVELNWEPVGRTRLGDGGGDDKPP